MECSFKVGDKVVYVGDEVPTPPDGYTLLTEIIDPKRGSIYTVRAVDIGVVTGAPCLRLEEIPDQSADVLYDGEEWVVEITFDASDFRPVVSRSTDKSMSILRSILDSKTTDQPVKVTA